MAPTRIGTCQGQASATVLRLGGWFAKIGNIVIKARHECGIKVKNCKVLAEFIEHDLTNTRILIRQPNAASALISYPSNQERKIILPTSAILVLPVSCRLHTANFTNSSVEYTNLADYEKALVNISEISECRNISCTAFSKVLEGQVLLKLGKEFLPDPNQYGGLP